MKNLLTTFNEAKRALDDKRNDVRATTRDLEIRPNEHGHGLVIIAPDSENQLLTLTPENASWLHGQLGRILGYTEEERDFKDKARALADAYEAYRDSVGVDTNRTEVELEQTLENLKALL